ncbi:MAG TPA: hypothetical protein VFN35_35120 [Ktedonobacteraceae bacterium]|nr:hypothetical protein [Ktedonobacteraceae bacterium]
MDVVLCLSRGLTKHNADIFKIAAHPKTSQMAITGYNGVWLWDMQREEQATPFIKRDIIYSTFSPSGDHLAITENRRLCLWDVQGKKELWGKTLQEKKQYQFLEVWDAAFSPDGKVLASVDQAALRLWDVATGKVFWKRQWVTDTIYSVAFSPDGRHLAAGDGIGSVRIWQQAAGWSPATLAGRPPRALKMSYPSFGIWCVAFSPDGRFLASSNSLSDGTTDPAGCVIRLWDVASGGLIRQFAGFVKDVCSLAFSPDGHFLAAAGDQTVRLWDVNDGKELWSLPEPDEQLQPRSVAWNFDSRFLAVARGKEIQLWQVLHS